MIEYFIVSIMSIVISLFQKRFKYALSTAFVVITVFLAIRYNFGNDYSTYLTHFDIANNGSLSDALSIERFEVGWVILCRLCKPIGFFGMVILLTVFENIILYYVIKKYVPKEWYWLALFCYLFTNSLCLTGLSMMRQFLAMCICLLAFDFAIRRKIVIPLLLVILAGQFHTSAYVCLPFCFIGLIKDIKLSSFSILLIVGALILLSFSAVSLFGNYLVGMIEDSVFNTYEDYIGRDYKNVSGISTVFNYFLLGIILFMQRKQDFPNRLFALLFIPFFVIDLFKPIIPMITRIGLFFYILFPICMPNAIRKLDNSFQVVTIALLLLFRVYGYFTFIQSPGWGNSFMTYSTIFSANHWM